MSPLTRRDGPNGVFAAGCASRRATERVMPVRIGEILFKERLITTQELQEVVSKQKVNGGKLDLC